MRVNISSISTSDGHELSAVFIQAIHPIVWRTSQTDHGIRCLGLYRTNFPAQDVPSEKARHHNQEQFYDGIGSHFASLSETKTRCVPEALTLTLMGFRIAICGTRTKTPL